ncbi:hypothetical protein [Gibbsiella quercinecans]|uniref:hypothetical protein n=1 Tax=Gibbsiella quercinecans TaxID=929813 RepID=UPI00242A60F9|nr:hypothetical protein [Gibbsiella quercinecans]
MNRFFVYDPDSGVDFYPTAKKAQAEADAIIDSYREWADEGWSEEVKKVCWGEVKQHAVMCDERPADDGSDLDCMCDYRLEDVPE